MIYPAQLSLGTITRFLNNISLIFVSIFLKNFNNGEIKVILTLSSTSLPDGTPGFFFRRTSSMSVRLRTRMSCSSCSMKVPGCFEPLTWKRSPRKNELIPSPERLVVKHSAFYTELEIYLPGCHPSF